MERISVPLLALVASVVLVERSGAAPTASVSVVRSGQELIVTARGYRIRFKRAACDFQLDLRDRDGRWRQATKERGVAEFALVEGDGVRTTAGSPARLRHWEGGGRVVVGMTTVLSTASPTTAKIHFICTDDGVLVHFSLPGERAAEARVCWPMPRLRLDETLFDAYTFWREPDEVRSGRTARHGDRDTYFGVSTWGQRGDTAPSLSARHPAVIARSERAGLALGVVFLRYASYWAGSSSFIQRHTPGHLFFYPAQASPEAAAKGLWAWLAPFPPGDTAASVSKVERLLGIGETLALDFRPIAPEPDEDWSRPVPDFPQELRRARPVEDIRDAVVYTVNEYIRSEYGITLARKVGSDVLIRGWFKWAGAHDYARSAHLVPKAHALGALFGGGITCSALYHGENGLTERQVLDMATRGPDGKLVDAWGEPGCRHGTLSNPAYLDYLLSWCRRQIDAGADYLFMDEHTAVLQQNEGFDDYSIRDFRDFLVRRYCDEKGWKPGDARWRETFKIDLGDRAICPGGTIPGFHYRAYLGGRGLTTKPHGGDNPLASEWHAFRRERDDRAWKWLTDAIRAYAASSGQRRRPDRAAGRKERRVLISANGLARYVDLQVLGVWGRWRVRDGSIDLGESQIEEWASIVSAGRALAEGRVPVVFFHDWGFGGFPWMKVSPADRKLWMRVRGAEIYAAGGFFAFPVHGPFGNDALRDGTLREVARQTAFYQRHKGLYLDARLLGFGENRDGALFRECITSRLRRPEHHTEQDAPLRGKKGSVPFSHLSLALWRRDDPPALILHVINRQAEEGGPARRTNVAVRLPAAAAPKVVRVVSPDWENEKTGKAEMTRDGRAFTVLLPELEAYAVAILDYDVCPRVALSGRRVVPVRRWARPDRNEFVVEKGGTVREQWALNGFLQGRLHTGLRNPPTFLVRLPRGRDVGPGRVDDVVQTARQHLKVPTLRGGALRVHVRAVATLGARLECLVDGRRVGLVDLPDRDGKNDASAREYDATYDFAVPPGRHRVTVRNVGGDWASVAWYAFTGEVVGY